MPERYTLFASMDFGLYSHLLLYLRKEFGIPRGYIQMRAMMPLKEGCPLASEARFPSPLADQRP